MEAGADKTVISRMKWGGEGEVFKPGRLVVLVIGVKSPARGRGKIGYG